ncbi:MAG: hypothetical protein V1731_01940 [Candidatus Aenigmatarchaeota archaeon]
MKATAEDTTYLVVGIIMLILVAYLIYSLIGGGDCDALAKRSANNVRNAIETVATTGTYTAENPYPTFVMLCQQHVESPLTLSALTYPEYMIYWEHFPESPSNIGESLIYFDESYPFTKNFAQLAGFSYGSAIVTGTLGKLAKAVYKATKPFAEAVTPSSVQKIFKAVFIGIKWTVTGTERLATPFIAVAKYLGDVTVQPIRYILQHSGLTKLIKVNTIQTIMEKGYGHGIVNAMADNLIVESVETAGKKQIKTVLVEEAGITYRKAVLTQSKWEEVSLAISELKNSAKEGDQAIAEVFEKSFASPDEAERLGSRYIDVEDLVKNPNHEGFDRLIKDSMTQAGSDFKKSMTLLSKEKGVYQRPINALTDPDGILEITEETNDHVWDLLKLTESTPEGRTLDRGILDKISIYNSKVLNEEMKIPTNPAKLRQALRNAFSKGATGLPVGDTKASMVSSLQSFFKEGVTSTNRETSELYTKLLTKGSQELTGPQKDEVMRSFIEFYRKELVDSEVPLEIVNSFDKKFFGDAGYSPTREPIYSLLGTNNFMDSFVNDFRNLLKDAGKEGIDLAGKDADKYMETAMLANIWKLDPETIVNLLEDVQFQLAGTKKLVVLNIESFFGPDYLENQLKYSYLKDEFAGCSVDNLVCLNLKGIEQKAVDMTKEEQAQFETAYKVSTSVYVELKRGNPIIPGTIGQVELTENPRFHLVSPCLARVSFYNTGELVNDKPVIMASVDKCPDTEKSNYCYYDEDSFRTSAAWFWGSMACSIGADILKPAFGIGFGLQIICATGEIKGEYDTAWPFPPFEPLLKDDMNLAKCEVEKNPVAAAKLLLTSCCRLAQCNPSYECLGAQYSDSNSKICGKPVCTLQDLANKAGMDYRQACSCQA